MEPPIPINPDGNDMRGVPLRKMAKGGHSMWLWDGRIRLVYDRGYNNCRLTNNRNKVF